jgi:hypothetical protein
MKNDKESVSAAPSVSGMVSEKAGNELGRERNQTRK